MDWGPFLGQTVAPWSLVAMFAILIARGKLIPESRANREVELMERRLTDQKEISGIQRETIAEQNEQIGAQAGQIEGLMKIGATVEKVLLALPKIERTP